VFSKKSELTSPFWSRAARVMAMASTPALSASMSIASRMRCAALKAFAPLRDRPDHSDFTGAARNPTCLGTSITPLNEYP
jgi:hypothetical protein